MKMPCELITWQSFYHLSRRLAHSIVNSGFQPDMIIGIERGGYMPARIIVDFLNTMELAGIKIEHYHGAKKTRQAAVTDPLSAGVDGKHLLLVDDISDSGDTFQAALKHIREKGQPAGIKTAVLHHKTVSSVKPDYYATIIQQWRWVTYPWAVNEDLSGFIEDMDPIPPSRDSIKTILKKDYGIDVTDEQIEDALFSLRSKRNKTH